MRKIIPIIIFTLSFFTLVSISAAYAQEYYYIGQPEILVRSSDHTTVKLKDPSGKEVGITTFQNGFILYGNGEPQECKIDGPLATVFARIPIDVYTSSDFYETKPIRTEYLYVVKASPAYEVDYIIITGYNKSFNDCITTDGLGFTLCPMYLGVDSNSDGGFIFLYGGKSRNSQVIISFKNGKLVAGQPELLSPYVVSLMKSSSRVLI